MVYLILALIVAFAPLNIKNAEVSFNEKPWFQFTKISTSQWQGTHSSGKQSTYTVSEDSIQENGNKPRNVVGDSLNIPNIKKISDLKNMPLVQDMGSYVWKFELKANGFIYSVESKNVKTKPDIYAVSWSE